MAKKVLRVDREARKEERTFLPWEPSSSAFGSIKVKPSSQQEDRNNLMNCEQPNYLTARSKKLQSQLREMVIQFPQLPDLYNMANAGFVINRDSKPDHQRVEDSYGNHDAWTQSTEISKPSLDLIPELKQQLEELNPKSLEHLWLSKLLGFCTNLVICHGCGYLRTTKTTGRFDNTSGDLCFIVMEAYLPDKWSTKPKYLPHWDDGRQSGWCCYHKAKSQHASDLWISSLPGGSSEYYPYYNRTGECIHAIHKKTNLSYRRPQDEIRGSLFTESEELNILRISPRASSSGWNDIIR